MRNHDQKAKDMAESVLPSTARRRAREARRDAHARHRTHQRDQLRRLQLTGPDTEIDPTMERRRASDLSELVWDRRGADKTGPLERWARVRVQRDPALRGRPLDDQVAELARLLPDNLIGRHAAQHIRWALEYDQRRAARGAQLRSDGSPESLVATIAEVRRILELGRHRELNHAIRALVRAETAALTEPSDARPVPAWRPPAQTAHRLLGGLHDVEDFAAAHHRHAPVRNLIACLATPIEPPGR